jgi:hypothetical protein
MPLYRFELGEDGSLIPHEVSEKERQEILDSLMSFSSREEQVGTEEIEGNANVKEETGKSVDKDELAGR